VTNMIDPFIEKVERSISHATKARLQYFYYKRVYNGSAPKPWSILWIEPCDIGYIVTPRNIFRNDPSGYYMLNGSWDQSDPDRELTFVNKFEDRKSDPGAIPIENYYFHKSVKQYINGGIEWESTKVCQWAKSNPPDLPENKKESILNRSRKIDRLRDSIEKKGYRLQEELSQSGLSLITHTLFPPEVNEIMVSIGRNGNFIFEDGKHRFGVADALEVEKIPVRVFVRHNDWQKKRHEMWKADSLQDLDERLLQFVEHPDMQDVIP